jgi:hypothetical protein
MTGRVIAARKRERGGIPRMIGRWPDGIRFEDANVPIEGYFKGRPREAAGIWPESSLGTVARIARGR